MRVAQSCDLLLGGSSADGMVVLSQTWLEKTNGKLEGRVHPDALQDIYVWISIDDANNE